MRISLVGPRFCLLGLLSFGLILTGCGSGILTPAVESNVHTLQGNVHGGQQPVVGATIQLYAAGAPGTGGAFGVGSTPLIAGPPPVSDANGNFNITGRYVLPTTPSYLYIVATGGSPGVGSPVNPSSTLMSVVNGCTGVTTLSPTLFVNINEVTTVASVTALRSFMAPPSATNSGVPTVGAPSTAVNALQNAFATANNLASTATGQSLQHSQSYATSDQNALTVNTLADILASCVNSDPRGSQCAALFSNATPSGASFVASDTIQAMQYIAQNTASNVPALFNLVPPSPPFVGLTSPPSTFDTIVATSASACQMPVSLGSAGNYAVLAGSSVTNSSTASDMTVILGGSVGVSPGTATTGFTPGTYTAVIDNNNAAAAEGSLTTAYTTAAGLLSPAVLPTDMTGITFTPGLYNTASAVTLNAGSVTLDAQNDPNAVFIFQIGSTFTAAPGTQVVLINGASAKNVFWQVGSSATINASAAWQGNIIAFTAISMGTDATLQGRAMARNGAVTLLSNKITVPQ